MPINVSISGATSTNIRFTTNTTPIVLKNEAVQINEIQDIPDVDPLDVEQGATLVYNSLDDKYEIRKLQLSDIGGTLTLDGGSF